MNFSDKHDYIAQLAATVADPTPANFETLLVVAQTEGVGARFAARHRQALLDALNKPTDENLDHAARLEVETSDALGNARRRLVQAQDELDKAEAASVSAKQNHLVARSARLAGERALTDPTIAAALEALQPSEATN